MKKILLAAAVVIAVLLGWYGYRHTSKPETGGLTSTAETFTVSQRVLAGESTPGPTPVPYRVAPGETALQLLQRTTSVKTTGSGENAFVAQIGPRAADAKKREYWAFYVNGNPAKVGAGGYKLISGDTIEWRIETY